MGTNKIKLSFVNNGKEFVVPYMTLKKQEELQEDAVELEKKYKDGSKEYIREINKHMVARVLQTIDPSVSIENINNMHPDDYIFIFNKIWMEGRELGESRDFRQKK